MPSAITFARNLTEAGINQKAAELIADALGATSVDNIATKADLANAKHELKTDAVRLEKDISTEIAEFRAEVKTGFAEVKSSIYFLYWAVGIGIVLNLATITLAVTILTRFPAAA